MSLVVWLPLNGDSKNQGTKQYTETINTLEYTSNGKTTNKCMNLGRLQYNKNPLGMVGSICFWIYPKSTDEGSNGKPQPIFGNDTWSTSSRKWTLYLYSSQPSVTPHNTSLHSWGCQKDGSKDPNGDFVINGVLKESAWNHVCVTHDLDYEYVYINGTLKRKVKWNSNGTFTFDVGTPIIYGDFYNDEANYRLNDFRIYDHCLTQSEVSEIAKGMMLHYTFENPYVMETTDLSTGLTLTNSSITMNTDSIGKYITKPTGLQWYDGLKLSNISVKPGRYYTWSIDIMTTEDCYYTFDTNATCSSAAHTGNDMHFIGGKSIRSSEDIITIRDDGTISTKGKLEAYKWKRAWTTVKIHSECSNPFIWHSICPIATDKSVKMYYKNSMVEESPYPTPYTSSNREAGLIRDNSGMGNDGTQVYQRIEIPIISSPAPGNGGGAWDITITENSGTYTITNFNSADNQCVTLGKINYNSRYHYLNSLVSYEFDITLKDLVMADGKTLSNGDADSQIQGLTHFKDGTSSWIGSPTSVMSLSKRLGNGKVSNATFHIYAERQVTNQACLTNVSYYDLGFRFNYVKSGTIIISNVHAYYQNLDTSTLSLSDNSAIGTHSAYFNGKNRINCGVVVPEEMDELTLSCWVYKEDWSTLNPNWSTTGITPSIIGNIDAGGFGLKVEKGNNVVNWVTYYKGKGYGPDNLIDCSDFTSGWHLFTGVSTKTKKSLYVDGKIINSNDITWNAPILSKDTIENIRVSIYIGTEVNGDYFTNLENVYIDDVRLYSTALSPEDIKALYNVKAKIDNKSNLYCNQLVETKSENIASDLSEITECGYFRCTCSTNYDTSNKILTFTLTSNSTESYTGPYILNKYYGGSLVTNETYRYSIYVKFSRSGRWKVGEERIINNSLSPFYNGQKYEAGKWYKIENEGVATAAQVNFIFYYCSGLLETGDKIEIRDFKMYRLYDDENYNPGPNIKGQYKTFELNETFNEDVENSGATIVDKYGAEWLEVFYHNNKSGTILFANEQEALHTNSQYKFSILDQLENFRGTNNKFEFLLEYPDDFPNEYNRWKQTDNPVTVSEVIGGDPYKAAGYESVHIDWDSNRTDSSICNTFSGLLRSSRSSTYTLIDGSIGHGNWHTAIGAMSSWNGGVPSPMIQSALGRIKLYVRIDNLPNRNEIFRQHKRQTKTKEIIEI